VPADEPAQGNLAAAQEAEKQKQNRLLAGKRSLGLGPPPEFLVDSLQRVGGAQRLPLRNRKSGKGKELVAGFLEASADGLAARLPLARKPNPRVPASTPRARLSVATHYCYRFPWRHPPPPASQRARVVAQLAGS
jgi:hypothetical protein